MYLAKATICPFYAEVLESLHKEKIYFLKEKSIPSSKQTLTNVISITPCGIQNCRIRKVLEMRHDAMFGLIEGLAFKVIINANHHMLLIHPLIHFPDNVYLRGIHHTINKHRIMPINPSPDDQSADAGSVCKTSGIFSLGNAWRRGHYRSMN
jgi:hypothetical protein